VNRHFLILASVVVVLSMVCLLAARRGTAVDKSASQPAPSALQLAHDEAIARQQAEYQAQTREHAAGLAKLETEQRLRSQLEDKQRESLLELQRTRGVAWSAVLTTNWPAYEALRQQAAASPAKTAPCTLCNGRGLMAFCVVCEHSGKCVQCKGTGRGSFGERCPACRGSGKCYLCFGTGKMACLFCDDGIIYLKGPAPLAKMPVPEAASSPGLIAKPTVESPESAAALLTAQHRVSETPISPVSAAAPPRQADGSPLATLNQLGLAAVLLLAGFLAVRKLAPWLGDFLNNLSNPPRKASAATAQIPSAVLAPSEVPPAPLAQVGTFLEIAPNRIEAIRTVLSQITRSPKAAARQKTLAELCSLVRSFRVICDAPDLAPVWQFSAALEGLLNQLSQDPSRITTSALGTVSGAIALLESLSVPGVTPDLAANPPPRFLVVDDDPISRHALSVVLKKALEAPDLAADGGEALTMATQRHYDVIFLDVEMPGMDGFELCSRIRNSLANGTTPVVFVTGHSDFDSRARSSAAGGHDLIAKPFQSFELIVKTLTLLLSTRLQSSLPDLARSSSTLVPAHTTA
jgi:CheY-like chemotaxis protein